jgi:hypothetical protein
MAGRVGPGRPLVCERSRIAVVACSASWVSLAMQRTVTVSRGMCLRASKRLAFVLKRRAPAVS